MANGPSLDKTFNSIHLLYGLTLLKKFIIRLGQSRLGSSYFIHSFKFGVDL